MSSLESMNLMILRDRKLFEKSIEVPFFLPEHQILVRRSAYADNENEYVTPDTPQFDVITFYPKGEIREVGGVKIRIYEEN